MTELEDVIQNSIAEATGNTETPSGETPTTDTGAGEPVTADAGQPAADAAPATSEPVAGAETATVAAVTAPVRRGPIPYDRHEAVLTKTRREYDEKLAATQRELDSLAWARAQDAQDKLRALDLADSNPQVFFEALLKDPRYAALAANLRGAGSNEPAKAAAAPAAAAPVGDQPKPDVLLPDGTLTYSEEGLQKLLDWTATKARTGALEEMDRRLDERLGPVKPLIESHQTQVLWNQAVSKQRVVLEEARSKWPGFKDAEPAIKAFMGQRGNEAVSLEAAYRAVVIPKFQADRDSMRQQILDEINARPAAASQVRPPRAETAVPPSGPRDLEQVIAESIRGLAPQ